MAVNLKKLSNKLDMIRVCQEKTVWRAPVLLPWDIDGSWKNTDRPFEVGEFEITHRLVEEELRNFWNKFQLSNSAEYLIVPYKTPVEYLDIGLKKFHIEIIDWRRESDICNKSEYELTSIQVYVDVEITNGARSELIMNGFSFHLGGKMFRDKNLKLLKEIEFDAFKITNGSINTNLIEV